MLNHFIIEIFTKTVYVYHLGIPLSIYKIYNIFPYYNAHLNLSSVMFQAKNFSFHLIIFFSSFLVNLKA